MSPTCCGQKAKWTVISHNLSYWFCSECKQEVKEESADQLRKRLSSTPTKAVEPVHLTQEEIDELFNNIGNQRSYPYDPYLGLDDDDGDLNLKEVTVIKDRWGLTDETSVYDSPELNEIIKKLAESARESLGIEALNVFNSSFTSDMVMGIAGEDINAGDAIVINENGHIVKAKPSGCDKPQGFSVYDLHDGLPEETLDKSVPEGSAYGFNGPIKGKSFYWDEELERYINEDI